jgi:hypothetical protein
MPLEYRCEKLDLREPVRAAKLDGEYAAPRTPPA